MIKQIFKATLVAGTLDIAAAFTQAYLSTGITPDIVLRYIASGIFGKDAFAGHTGYIIFGLLVHFFIVTMCAIIYFLFYPRFPVLHKSIALNALLIAVTAWAMTTLVIIPLSKITPAPFDLTNAAIAIAILYICVGIPIALFAKSYFAKRKFHV